MTEVNVALAKAHQDSLMAQAGEKVAKELHEKEVIEEKKDKEAADAVAKASA